MIFIFLQAAFLVWSEHDFSVLKHYAVGHQSNFGVILSTDT